MRKTLCFLFIPSLLIALGCKKDSVAKKIIDGLPVGTQVAVPPAQATQHLIELENQMLITVITVLNKLTLTNQSYAELNGPDGQSRYTFQRTTSRFGSATFTIQFKDENNAVIDPVSTQSSSGTLKFVNIDTAGSSTLFTYTQALLLTLEFAGNPTSNRRITGTSSFNNASNSVLFTFTSPGSRVTFDGHIDGELIASGTGPGGQPITMSSHFTTDHVSEGAISWEGNRGGIHLDRNGFGYIVTNQERIVLE